MTSQLQLSDIPNVNFGKFMLDSMSKFGDKIALIDGGTDRTMTYNDMIIQTKRLAAGLQSIGVTQGDVICMIAPNMPQYAVTYYASALVTAVFQPINPLYTKDDIARVFRDCQTKYVITVRPFLAKAREALTDLDHIKVIVFGEEEGCISYESLLDPRHGDYTSPECDPKTTTVTLLSSSGTTGFPKAVRWSHFGFIATLVVIKEIDVYKPDEKFLLYLPMFHIYGLLGLAAMANFTGFPMVTMARFQPEDFLAIIQKHKVTILHTVPPIMVMLAKHPKVSEYDLSSVSSIVCGAAPLSEDIEAKVKERMNIDFITQVYGMTEVGMTHCNTPVAFKHKSVGKLVPLVEMKIIDVETGKPLGKHEEGEIWVRGPNVSQGYLNLPEATKEMFLDDEWCRTGDIGKEDDEGYLFVVDRLKELIKYKAYQVAPATLEDILLRHDAVADAGVIGIPDEEAGELPKAFVVLKPGREATEADIQAFVAGLVAPHMKIRGGVEFIQEVPRSLSGKILRRVFRAKVLAGK